MADIKRWTFRLLQVAVLTLGITFLLTACGGGGRGEEDGYSAVQTQEDHDSGTQSVVAGEHSQAGLAGQKLFAANCIQCHGDSASGTSMGPPLVHQIYEPGHHANASFVIAVARGVRSHHWDFGNMPAVESLTIDEIYEVICYVRELQLANDIIDEVPASSRC